VLRQAKKSCGLPAAALQHVRNFRGLVPAALQHAGNFRGSYVAALQHAKKCCSLLVAVVQHARNFCDSLPAAVRQAIWKTGLSAAGVLQVKNLIFRLLAENGIGNERQIPKPKFSEMSNSE